jgi:hypothetical protein
MVSLPVTLRARDFRLYTQGGRRLVDLWQAGGRTVLGHKPAGVLRDLKNCAARGLFAPLPHPQEGRLSRALARLLPGRVFRFYADRLSLRSALEAAGFPWGPFPDPALGNGIFADDPPGGGTLPGGDFPVLPGGDFSSGTLPVPPGGVLSGQNAASAFRGPVLWRPFLDLPSPAPGACPLLVPLLPWPLAPWVLALDAALETAPDAALDTASEIAPEAALKIPPSDPLPPVLLAAAARSVYDTIAAGQGGGRPVYPRINRALHSSRGSWRRRGIYLSCPALQGGTAAPGGGTAAPGPAAPSPGWEDLFRRFLEGGFLIPPGPAEPLILPAVLSPGEEAKLAALLQPLDALAF